MEKRAGGGGAGRASVVCTTTGTFGSPLNFWSSSSGRLSIFGVPPPLNFHPHESNVRRERQNFNSWGWNMRKNRKERGKEGGEAGFLMSIVQSHLDVHSYARMLFITLNYPTVKRQQPNFFAAPVSPRSCARNSEGQACGPQRGAASLRARRPSLCRLIPKTLAPTPNHRCRAQHELIPRGS